MQNYAISNTFKEWHSKYRLNNNRTNTFTNNCENFLSSTEKSINNILKMNLL